MAITEEEKQLREALRASWRTAVNEARRRGLARRRQRLWQDAVAISLEEAAQRSWEEEMQNSELEAATMLSAYEEARQRQSRLWWRSTTISSRAHHWTACQTCRARF